MAVRSVRRTGRREVAGGLASRASRQPGRREPRSATVGRKSAARSGCSAQPIEIERGVSLGAIGEVGQSWAKRSSRAEGASVIGLPRASLLSLRYGDSFKFIASKGSGHSTKERKCIGCRGGIAIVRIVSNCALVTFKSTNRTLPRACTRRNSNLCTQQLGPYPRYQGPRRS